MSASSHRKFIQQLSTASQTGYKGNGITYAQKNNCETYPKAVQENMVKAYNEKYTAADGNKPAKEAIRYKAPDGHDEHVEHFTNFFNAIRNRTKVPEDAVFGFRAAAPCLACNDSYFQKKRPHWGPVNMKLLS